MKQKLTSDEVVAYLAQLSAKQFAKLAEAVALRKPTLSADTPQITRLLGKNLVSTEDTRGGKMRIAGRRITVADVANWHLKERHSVARIARDYGLTRAQIYAALAYYYENQLEIDRHERLDEAKAEAILSRSPSKLKAKLGATNLT
ncbi:MAG: DUF433 domain-containing protein [Anaerolineae bacterium]|nr:DUF433 domain-containing protein [Anaerolineae bacterium]